MKQIGSWLRSAAPSVIGTALFAIMMVLSAPASAQTGTIEGRVTQRSGEPLAGAQVALVGTNIGARTDDDGRFVLLNVPAGRTQIRVLLIGFTMGTIDLAVIAGSVTTANVELNTSVLRLDEIVVTGTAGQARRREVGNSIAQISANDVLSPPSDMSQMLQARAPGVQVMQTSGMAGAGSQIRLRGAVSVSMSNMPLIYIDGVRVRSEGFRRNRPPVGFTGRSGNIEASPLNDINPSDIERIEIIKGAAASTLYGTEAAAGVIQIFTKRGKAGAAAWTVQTEQGFAHTLAFGTDENPFMNLKPCNTGTSCWDQWTQNETIGQCAENGSGPPGSNEVNIHCSWLRDGYRQKYAGSVGGGSEGFTYFLSGAFNDYDGVLPNDNQKTVVARGNFSFDVFDDLRVDVNTSYTNNRIANTAAGNNAHGVTLNVMRAERNYFGDSDPNNLRQLLNQEIKTEINHLVTGTTVNYTPVSWFSNRFTLGYDLAQQENRNLRPFGFVRARRGILSDEQIKYQTLTADYAANINFTISSSLRSTFSFGGQSVTEEVIRTTAYGQDFPGPGVPTVSSAALYIAREDRIRTLNAGFFVQDLLAWQDKYFLTVGARFDGNSTFGKNLGIEVYPKAQVSYVISDEDFFPESMGEMKLRAAFGFSGRAPDAFDAIRTWDPIPVGGNPGFTPGNVGNADVGPEKTREIEVGVDWAFMDNKVSADFTYYQQKTTDALFNVRQVPSLGFLSSQAANVGIIENKGIELSVNVIVIDQPDFGLDVGNNFYTNKSEVLDLGAAVPFGAGGGWVEVGLPVMVLTGITTRNRDAIAAPDTACGPTCAANDEFPFGPQQPTFTWGHSVTLRLPEGITLSARGELQTGAWINLGQAASALSRSVQHPLCSGAHGLLNANPVPAGLSKGDAGYDDALNSIGLTAWERQVCIPANHDNDLHKYKQDFWKLRDLTARIPVGFAFQQLNSAVLTFTLQNYFRNMFDLPMFDPEMVGRGSVSEQNRSISEHVPPPAIFTASLRVTF